MARYVFEALGVNVQYGDFDDVNAAVSCGKIITQMLNALGYQVETLIWRENDEGFYDKIGECKIPDKKKDGGR